MNPSEASYFEVTRAATSMQFSPDTPPCTPPLQPSLPADTARSMMGSATRNALPSSMLSPAKERHATVDALDNASPPPRPPKCDERDGDVRPDAGDSAPANEQRLLHLEPPAPDTHRNTVVVDSEDAATPHCEPRHTRGPFLSLESSDTDSQALFATTQLLNATTMPLARSEGSRENSSSVFSPSVHRPVAAAAAAIAAGNATGGGHGRCEPEDVWARDPSDRPRCEDPANGATASRNTPMERPLPADTSAKDPANGVTSNVDHQHHHDNTECSESDDEDEVGLFQETVLFMNNTLHSLGSTRHTPNRQTPHQTPLLAGSPSSPVPSRPDALGSTPTKPTRRSVSGGCHGNVDSDECRPDRDCAENKIVGGGARGYLTLPSEMNASATTTSTLAYRTCPASPATTCSPGVSAPSLSPFLATQLPCTDHPTTTTTTTAATEATHRDRNTNAAIPNGNSNSDSEYLFIDNHDGTAYLADASLQLDGSYVLGETILLARSEAASPNSTSMRQRTNGAVSPVVVLQTADRLPPQHRREQFAHRPLRGTTLQPAAATAGAARAAAPFTSPTPRPLAGSPTPMSFNDSFASPVAPSVARVLVRRSPAPERAVSVEEDAHHHPLGASCVLGSTFNHSFRFDQTLLVPLDDTLRSSLAAPASPSVAADRHGGPAPSIYRSNDTDAPRWDSGASPLVMMPASPAASVVVYRSARSPALPMASSASRASPTPHAPSVTRQIASQQARATRDTRPSRPEQDIVYLVPPGAATAIVTPEDITQQGWIPVQVVDVLPASKGGSAPNSSSSSGYARNGGGNPPVMIEGRMVSPVPKDPAMQNEPAEEEEVVREQSLSRLSYGRTDERPANGTLRNASFSFASTLSASTLDCINRRLSYSLSDWASVRQRFGHSMSAGDPGSVSGVVMPPATPLTFSVIGGEGQQQQQQTTPTTASANVHMDCHCNAGVRLGGGGAVRDRVEGTWLEDGHDDGGSPVPLPPPGTPEPPQREQSPSRCTTTDAAPTTTHDTAETWTAAAAAESHLANSLLTSMSYQRPSTITTSDEYPGDYSMSLPLTSSASQSLGLNGGRARYSNAESLSLLHFPLQHQALRAPHPRRVSGATALSQAASSFSFQLLGEQSDQQGAGLSSNTNTNSNSAAAAAAAAATSFRTTYCTNPGSVAVTSLNPSVSGAGLPLSRGALGASVGARSTATGVGGATSRFPSHTQHYAAAAAERRRAGPTGTGAHVNAASLSTDSFAGRSGAVNRNVAQHHPYLSVQQRQQQQLARRVVAAGGGGNGGGLRRAAKARLVPDTSAFLPWSPLTITPEGSLNLPRNDADVAAAMTDACGLPMNLVPYSSSAETSTRTTTTTTTRTTTTTSGGESRSAQAVAQQLLDNRGGNEAVELSPEALRALNAAVAAVTRAADESSSISEAFVKEDGTLNKDAFVSSFLQHAASQAATSVGDTSVNAASTMTTTTTTTASGGEKSLAVSRASMTASEVHLPDHSRRYDFQFMTLMEATMNHFQGSVSAVSALEPEPQAPAPAAPTAAAALSATHVAPAGGEKENGNAVRTSAARKSESIDAVRPAGLRAGSLTNAARPSFKTRSPSHHTTAEDPTATTKNATA